MEQRDSSLIPTMCGRLKRAMRMMAAKGVGNRNADNLERLKAKPLRRRSTMTYQAMVRTQEQREKERDDEAIIRNPNEVFLQYSLPVSVGEWRNTACIHEQHITELAKTLTNALNFSLQKKFILLYLHEKMELSDYDETLQYGMRVQIVTDSEYIMRSGTNRFPTNLMLSAIISESNIIENKKPYVIQCGSVVTLSHHHCRTRRNVFCFVKCPLDARPRRSIVTYHENLYIRLFNRGAQKPVYLRCETLNTEMVGRDRECMVVTLSETVDRYCQFQLQSLDRFKRQIRFRAQVPTFERLLICHSVTRRYLSVEQRLFVGSMIVGKEFKACCFTVRECNNLVTSENFWHIRTRGPDEEEDD